MNPPFDLLINSYLDNKIGIDPLFITEKLANGLQEHIKRLQHDKLMTAGGIGNEAVQDKTQLVRGDTIYWMDKSHDNVFEQEFLQKVEDLISYLNSTYYTGINSYEFHYAVYPSGSFYKKHKDQFRNNDNRKFSLINYLNENWEEKDGGQLFVYPESGMQKIEPHAQTAVFFKSDEMEHEVSLAHKSRMSITGWLKTV